LIVALGIGLGFGTEELRDEDSSESLGGGGEEARTREGGVGSNRGSPEPRFESSRGELDNEWSEPLSVREDPRPEVPSPRGDDGSKRGSPETRLVSELPSAARSELPILTPEVLSPRGDDGSKRGSPETRLVSELPSAARSELPILTPEVLSPRGDDGSKRGSPEPGFASSRGELESPSDRGDLIPEVRGEPETASAVARSELPILKPPASFLGDCTSDVLGEEAPEALGRKKFPLNDDASPARFSVTTSEFEQELNVEKSELDSQKEEEA
jgi:hypothetical protein